MSFTANRIVLISRGRHDEALAGADLYPGMTGLITSTGTIIPVNIAGYNGPLNVMEEDALQGLDITQKLPNANQVPFRRAAKGDVLYMLLQNGQNIAEGVGLMNAGDGTLIANPTTGGGVLYQIVAPSTVITNLGTETAFSNGSYTIPANFLQVGDRLHVRAKAFLIAVNSTNTHRIRLYLGASPITLADSTALALVANDVVIIDVFLTIRTITASGTFIADGLVQYSISGTFTQVPFTIASTTLDSTVAETLVIKSLASATSSGNQIRLDEFQVDIQRDAGVASIVTSAEAINNSAGAGSNPVSAFNSAAFIRCWVN